MGITREGLADHLDDSEYPLHIPLNLKPIAAEAGLVIVYGASDDLMEFDGAIYDEFDCYEGGTALIDEKGLLPDRENIEDDDELEDFFARKKKAKSITSIWNPGDGYSWKYETAIPHSTFEIVEDGEPYCRGIVFSLADLG